MKKRCSLILIVSCFAFQQIYSQDSITRLESVEIKLTAERTLNQFKQLLNFIANSEVGQQQISDVINRSHSGSFNKIFDTASIIVEDDVNPNHKSGSYTMDLPVEKYLQRFDISYSKGSGASVVFSNVRVSNVKRSGRFYVKVYYNSFFPNKSKVNDTPYTVTNRVAEMYTRKVNNKWSTQIASISFFNPADTANDVMNDVVLKYEGAIQGESLSNDSAAVLARLQSFEEELKQKERQKEIEQYQKETRLFNELMEKGEQAWRQKDYTEALKNFTDAKELKPYDPLPLSRINRVNSDKALSETNKLQVYQGYVKKAELAELNRDYKGAIDFYNKAKNEMPEEAAKHESKLKALTTKFRNLAELEERYQAGQFKQAIDDYDALIKKDKTNSDYFLGRGKCYDKLGETKRAFKDYDQALQLEPNNIQALLYRGDLYKRTNDPFKASTDYKDYVLKFNTNTHAYLELADLLMAINANNTNQAVRYLDEALAIVDNQRSPELYMKKGLLLFDKNNHKEADANFSTAIKLDSNHALAYFNRGKCQLIFKNIESAANDFAKARKNGLDSQHIRTIENFAQEFYDRSVSRAGSSKDSAIILVNYAIAVNPYHATYRFTKGRYYFSLNQYKAAISCFDQAIQLYDSYVEGYYERGLSYYFLADYPSAIENWKRAVSLNPQLYTGHKGLADAYYAQKDYSNASVNGELALKTINSMKTDPAAALVADVYNVVGKSYYYINDTEKAINALKSAIRKNPSYAEAYYYRGLSYSKRAELTEAIADYMKAVSLDSRHAEWYYSLAHAFRDKKDYSNAAANYGLAVKLDTSASMPEALYLRGFSNYQMQNYPPALNDYLAYASLKRDTTITTFNQELANIYLNVGKLDSALILYNNAYVKDSTNGYTMYGMAIAHNLKGNKGEAMKWFEKSFQLKTVQPGEIKKEKLLATIKDDKDFKKLIKKYY